MAHTRRQRRWLASWLIATLLFMQLATAAYACPAETASRQAGKGMVDMPGCTMGQAMDSQQPQLCKAHCQQGQQAVNPVHAGDASTFPVLLTVLNWAPVSLQAPQTASSPQWVHSGASPPGSPPLYLALLVLRN